MKDVFIALLVLLPPFLFIVWQLGYSAGYLDAKVEDRNDKANGCAKCGSILLGRGLTLGQLSVKKKGGVR